MTSRREAQRTLTRARETLRQTAPLDDELHTKRPIRYRDQENALIQRASRLRYSVNENALKRPRFKVRNLSGSGRSS
jgi:hypothetical protein